MVKIEVDTITPIPFFDVDGVTVLASPPSEAKDFLKEQIEQEWTLTRSSPGSAVHEYNPNGPNPSCQHPFFGGACCPVEQNYFLNESDYGKKWLSVRFVTFCDATLVNTDLGITGETFSVEESCALQDACSGISHTNIRPYKWRYSLFMYSLSSGVPQHDPCSGPMPSFTMETEPVGGPLFERGFVHVGYEGACDVQLLSYSDGSFGKQEEWKFAVSQPKIKVTPIYENPLP